MAERFSCTRHAAGLGEPAYGTASQVRRWILLEQPGPWGRDALRESAIEPAVARALAARARELDARLLLLRRHGRSAPDGHACFVASTTPDVCRMEAFHLDEPRQLLDLDLAPLARHEPVGGRRVAESLFLVCTNGRHDPCCAEYGRPLAKALHTSHGQRLWECSHIGGDRFAANLVCLPEGVYYGRVGAAAGARVSAAHDAGLVDLEHYRGRSCLPFAAQAAEFYARRVHGLVRLDDLAALGSTPLDGSGLRVVFSGRDGRRFTVDVEVASASEARRLTCWAAKERQPPCYRLRRIEVGAAGAP